MHIILNHSSMVPIYEQLMEQIKTGIIESALAEGEALPSVRKLAGELRISALTVKKAYDKLEEAGFVTTVHGKGTFVAASDKQLALEARRRAVEEEFEKAMDDDFNTADAIAAIFDLVKYANTTATAESSKEYLQSLLDRIVKLGDVLGLILDKKEELLDADIEKLIEERQAARKAKDFARADAIRDELLEKGIILKDTREGVQWKKA